MYAGLHFAAQLPMMLIVRLSLQRRMTQTRNHNNKGFTLVEVMISLITFAVLTLIFAATVPLAKKTAHMNGQYAQAISLCQHKIDQLRAVGYGRINYTELSDAGIIDDNPTTSPFSFNEVDQVEEYLPQPNATLNVESLGADKLRITASITWRTTTYETKTSTASLTAIITNVE